jgi:hypothetical protein
MLRTSLALLLGAADMLVLDPWHPLPDAPRGTSACAYTGRRGGAGRCGVSVHSVGEVIEARNGGHAEGMVL